MAALVFLTPRGAAGQTRQGVLDQYCAPCHNEKAKVAGLVLTNLNPDQPAGHADVWEKVVRRLAAGEMPPAGLPRPSAAASDAFRAGLLTDLDAAGKQNPFAGRPVIRRLNRMEYANAIRDVLAIDLPVAERAAAGWHGGRLRQHWRCAFDVAAVAGAVFKSGAARE